MVEKILEVEHRPGEEIVVRFRIPKARLLPASSRSHLRIAEKELLLALRSIVDAAIESVERAEKGKKERTKIKVE